MRVGTILYITLALTLAGCSGEEVKTVSGPSGAEMATVRCTRTADQCLAKASAACNGGSYQVIESYSNAGGLVADLMPGPVTWFTMRFQCGASDGRLPTFPFRGADYVQPVAPTPTTTTCSSYGNTATCRSY